MLYLLTLSALSATALADIHANLAYNSPSFQVPQLEVRRDEVRAQHKRWEYYDGQLSFPYGVASGDPCE